MICVGILAAVTLGAVCAFSDVPTGRELAMAGVLAPLVAAGRLFPLSIAYRRRMVTDTAPLFAAALLLPPALAVSLAFAVLIASELVAGWRTRVYPAQVVFNSCEGAIGVAAASLVFSAVAGGPIEVESSRAMLAAALAGFAMFVANDLLVFSVVWAQVALRPAQMVTDFIRGRTDVPYDLALYGAGFVAALIGETHVVLLALLGVPLPVMYRAMRNQVALHQQTREAVISLADIVDERDPYTFGHCKRVAEFTAQICAELGLAHDLTDEIILAARVHDVGKVGIRDAVLLKPGRLSDEEFDHIKQHPEIGARLTARFPDFAKGTRYIRHHHERWDGTGYPSRLQGKDIPLGARIISVADTYDAMTSTRVYREGLSDELTRAEMARVAGTQLDPEAVRAWFRARSWEWPGPAEVPASDPPLHAPAGQPQPA